METNIGDHIEALLEDIEEKDGFLLEQPEQQSDEYDIGVTLSRLNYQYYLNCFIPGQVTEKDLPGKSTVASTLRKTMLPDVCEKIEGLLEEFGILYHRDILVDPSPDHTHVSYELLPTQEDNLSKGINFAARRLLVSLITKYQKPD